MLEIKENIALGALSTFQLGGNAAYAVTVISREELREAIEIAQQKNWRYRVLGGASNLLVAEEGFNGLVIWYRDKHVEIDPASGRVIAAAGALSAQVAGMSARVGLTGFEWAVGVPGTIGGAVYGNAGASGGEMKDVLVSVEAYEDGEMRTYTNAQCEFAYRHSIFKSRNAIILSATLQLVHAAEPGEPQKKVIEVLRYRQSTQPRGLASTGCIFKNYEPTDEEIPQLAAYGVPQQFLDAHRVPAGWLIEHTGLKGIAHGDARVSEVHGNFMVNGGNATAADIQALIKIVRARVAETFGVRLTEEITILK